MIDDLTAQKYFEELDLVTGTERDRMKSELYEYALEKKRQEEQETEEHFEKLYTDPAYFDALSKSEGGEEATRHSLKKSEVHYEAANRAYLRAQLGRDFQPMEYYSARDGYANSNFGKPEVGEKELYDLIKGQFEWEQKKRTALNEGRSAVIQEAHEMALSGNRTSIVDSVAKWKEKNAELVDEEKDAEYLIGAMRVFAQARDDMAEVAPMAARVWDSLTKFTQGQAEEGDLQALAKEMTRMTPEQQDKAIRYAIIASQASGDFDLSAMEQIAKNIGQSISRSFGWMEGPVKFTRVPGVGLIPGIAYEPLARIEMQANLREGLLENAKDGPEKTLALEEVRQARDMVKVVRKLREAAKEGIDPIRPVTPEGKALSWATAERGVYGLAGSIGYMAAAGINPMLGVAVYAQSEYEQMRTDYPDMDPNVALAAAMPSAMIQTAIDRLQLRAASGMLPRTSWFLGNMKAGIIRTGRNLAVGTVTQNVQEGLQDAVSAGIPALLSHIREDMPDADLDELQRNWVKERPVVFFATLPLAMIGAGAATIQDFKDLELTAKELKQAGFSIKQTTAIQQSADPNQTIREEAPKRTQANIEAGSKDVMADLKKADALQQDPEMPTLESVLLSDGSREYQVIRNEGGTAVEELTVKLTEADLEGKTVELATTDPATRVVQRISVSAKEAHVFVSQQIDSYSKLVECLTR